MKGNDFDILKIVVVGQESNEFKERVIDIIQEEYIAMCNHGMYSITETKTLLSQIYEKFINGDKFSNEVVENATLSIIESLVQMLGNLNKEDENTVDLLEIIYKENKSILDTVGYDGENEGLQKLKEFIAVEEESEFESYDPLETEELE